MRRTMRLVFFSLLLAVPSLGIISLLFYKGPVCADIQKELTDRVRALVSMHILKAPPKVELIQSCGVKQLPDALWFDIKKALYALGLSAVRPLNWQDLRLLPSKELLSHQELGPGRWVIRFEASIDKLSRQKLGDLVRRYLETEGNPAQVELRRAKVESAGALDGSKEAEKEQFPLRPFIEMEGRSSNLFIKQSESSLWDKTLAMIQEKSSSAGWQAILSASLYAMIGLFSLVLIQPHAKRLLHPWPRRRQTLTAVKSELGPEGPTVSRMSMDSVQATALYGPAFIEAWRERAGELIQVLEAIDPQGMAQRVERWLALDQELLYWTLVEGDLQLQDALVKHLSSEKLANLAALAVRRHSATTREEIKVLSRFLIELAREVAKASGWETAPLSVQLLSVRDWRSLAPLLSRSQRRSLAARIGGRRARCLIAQQGLDWVGPGAHDENAALSLQKLQNLLALKANETRDCLGADPEALACIDGFFADLTLDSQVNAELALAFQASIGLHRRSFVACLASVDQQLVRALEPMDDEMAALALYDSEKTAHSKILSNLGVRQEGVQANLIRFYAEKDKTQTKKWRMRSKSLQRFIERQLLIAEMFTSGQ